MTSEFTNDTVLRDEAVAPAIFRQRWIDSRTASALRVSRVAPFDPG